MVEIFKTDISEESQSKVILNFLNRVFPNFKINFDLEDCDNILRVEAKKLDPSTIMESLQAFGYQCERLE